VYSLRSRQGPPGRAVGWLARSGRSRRCAVVTARVAVAESCTAKSCTAKNCETAECASEAVVADVVTERPVIEIIEIIDGLGNSVVTGTLFDDAAARAESSACRGDGSCPTTRTALIEELRILAAAEATACDTTATACDATATRCPSQTGVPAGLAAQAAACASSGQPFSVLTVQNPYMPRASETTINVLSRRQAASRIDATADTLEVDGLYEAADMMRQIADELRLKAREQALSAPARAVVPNLVPYRPVYPVVPSAEYHPPVAPEAYQPAGEWSQPVLEAFRRAGGQPPLK
jgi:hypothetical protein